jgi:hypothetical protein
MRNRSGGSLALVVAIVCTIGLALLLFVLKYTRVLGSYQEQRTAIDAAALTAAKDLSRIVIEDPNFGFVSLSDYAPTGTNTAARDGYCMPVLGINTILATTRLDMIVADYMQDSTMHLLAVQDYNNALAAENALVTKLQNVISAIDKATDVDGNVINPQQDAIDEYNKNSVRMEGKSANLVPGSLKLSLGYVAGAQSSRALLPVPVSTAQVPASEQVSGCYLPNVKIFYKGSYPIVFAALNADSQLVDAKEFQSTLGIANSIPTIIRAEAQETYHDSDFQGDATHTVRVASAAEASSIYDQRPNPGAFCLSFPYVPAVGITTFGDIFKQRQIAMDPTDLLQTSLNGDYPTSPLSNFRISNLPAADPGHPPFTNLVSIAFYDWVRRAGTNVNITSLLKCLTDPLDFSHTGPQIHMFQIRPDGSVNYSVKSMPQVNMGVSQNQWRAISGLGFDCLSPDGKSGNCFDLQLTNFVYQEGRIRGGKHGGEPLPNPGVLTTNPLAAVANPPTLLENTTWPYQSFTTNSGTPVVRPTYNNEGIAVDLAFRLRN